MSTDYTFSTIHSLSLLHLPSQNHLHAVDSNYCRRHCRRGHIYCIVGNFLGVLIFVILWLTYWSWNFPPTKIFDINARACVRWGGGRHRRPLAKVDSWTQFPRTPFMGCQPRRTWHIWSGSHSDASQVLQCLIRLQSSKFVKWIVRSHYSNFLSMSIIDDDSELDSILETMH